MSPNMMTQGKPTSAAYAEASQDFSGREAALASQLRGGQQQMMQEMPQGRTVGNQYLAPNWAESLSGAVSKGMGAYDMGKARQGQKGLQQAREGKAQAQGVVAADERRILEEQRGIDEEQRGIDNAATAATADRGERTLARSLAQDETKEAARIEERENLSQYETEQIRLKEEEMLQKRDLAIMKLAAELDPTANMTNAEKTRINKEAGTFSNLSAAIGAAEKLQSEGGEIGGFKDIPIEKVTKWFGEGAGNLLANSDTFGYTPAEMAVRGSIDGSVEQYRRAFTGANLTQIEKFLGANWDPTATGIGTQEKIDRSRRLLDVLNNNRGVFNLDALEVPAPYQGSAQGAPEPNDIAPSLSITDLTPEMIDMMSDEELERYGL
jgi:hypothetical protein